MADNVMFNVSPGFNMDSFVSRLADTYRARGYAVNVANVGKLYTVSFDKGIGGINTILGLGVAVKANITLNENALNITFTDAEWTSKIISLVAGWLTLGCAVGVALIITGVIGVIKQTSLPKNIGTDATIIASGI